MLFQVEFFCSFYFHFAVDSIFNDFDKPLCCTTSVRVGSFPPRFSWFFQVHLHVGFFVGFQRLEMIKY
jgi:hypothetical protein